MQLYIVGKKRVEDDSDKAWDFQGVFDCPVKALAACRDRFYFVGPAILNESLPDETAEWPCAYYPIP